MTKQDFVRVVGGRKVYYDRQSDQYGKVHDDHILKPEMHGSQLISRVSKHTVLRGYPIHILYIL